MRDKFRLNFRIALPAALLTLLWLWWRSSEAVVEAPGDYELIRILPYVAVLALAVLGVNVMLVLFSGILLAGAVGLGLQPDYGVAQWAKDIYAGYGSMQEILILSLLIGGLGAMMKAQGGLEWVGRQIDRLSRHRSGEAGRRSGELSISAAVALTNVCTANNTVAILLAGGLARDIAERQGVDPRRSASLIDIFSCVVQGLLPYGAQVLLACSIAQLSPLELIGSIQYCWWLGLAALVSIALGLPKLSPVPQTARA